MLPPFRCTNLYELTVWLIRSMPMVGPKMSAASPKPGGQEAAIQQNFLFREVFLLAEKPAIFLPRRSRRSGVKKLVASCKNAVPTSPAREALRLRTVSFSDGLVLGLPR